MKSSALILALLITLVFNSVSFGQNNPVENLTWSQTYEYPNNFFELQWEVPAEPHDEIIGYNIYRNDELYRFQTETSLYSLYSDVYGFVSNCDIMFLGLDNQNQPYQDGFEIHVTAVYNPGPTESGYLQTAYCYGLALNAKNFIAEKAILFPNPTNGVLNIGNKNLDKIVVCDLSGKVIKAFAPGSQIDLGDLPKGLYVIKLFSEREVIIDKIVIE